MKQDNLFKFGVPNTTAPDKIDEYVYKNEYAVQETSPGERLIISCKKDQLNLCLDLIEDPQSQYWVLYVLTVSRRDIPPGRYQIPQPITKEELQCFCSKYKGYFETDSRAHLWIGRTGSKDLIVYDRHNVIYSYEDQEHRIAILKNRKYGKAGDIRFPVPHVHMYNSENDVFEDAIMDDYAWKYFPLAEGDED